jgi:hypothetical protein
MRQIFFALSFSLVLSAMISSPAEATVGGPTTIYDFKYNHSDESVYYIQLDGGGRGCPHVLKKMSLDSGVVSTVFSCDDGEKLINGNFDNIYLVNKKISDLTNGFKDLTPISLKKNNFEIKLSYLKDNYIGDAEKFKISSTFTASLFQNNEKIKDFEVSGCTIEQPFIFDGYIIPGFDKKIILLMSAKGDCFEGGYVSDSISVVGGVGNLDKTYYSSGYKGLGPIQPGEGSLIVYPENNIETKTESAKQDNKSGVIYFATIIAFIVGLIAGRFIKTK